MERGSRIRRMPKMPQGAALTLELAIAVVAGSPGPAAGLLAHGTCAVPQSHLLPARRCQL